MKFDKSGKKDELDASKTSGRKEGNAVKKPGFLGRAVLLSSLAAGAATCTPDVTINNIPYDPTLPDGGSAEQCITSCEPVEGTLREAGNSAGSNEMLVYNSILRLNGNLKDDGPTKAAPLQLEGCEDLVEGDLNPEESVTFTLNGQNVEVTVTSISYDAAGAKIGVYVVPAMSECVETGDGGSGGSGGDGGAGGSG